MYTYTMGEGEILFSFIAILAVWFVFDGLLRLKTRHPYRSEPKRKRSKPIIMLERSLEWTGAAIAFLLTAYSGTFPLWSLVSPVAALAVVQLIQGMERLGNVPEAKAHWHSFLGAVLTASVLCLGLAVLI